jgi:hypothetical protein
MPAALGTWVGQSNGAPCDAPEACLVVSSPPAEQSPPEATIEEAAEALTLAERTMVALTGRIATVETLLSKARDGLMQFQGHSPPWLDEAIRLVSEGLDEEEGCWPGLDQFRSLEVIRSSGYDVLLGLRAQGIEGENGSLIAYSAEVRTPEGEMVAVEVGMDLFTAINTLLDRMSEGEEEEEEAAEVEAAPAPPVTNGKAP